MGMSIDEATKCLRQWLKNGSNGLTDTRLGYIEGWFHKSDKEAYMTAIDTMRKYQKIQEIVKQKEYDRFNSHNYYGDFLRVQDVRKVIQYGNDD